ncbi:DUF397 domain-containing protein [Embleya sp. NPDC008237]|uniref:DUF397 domain-containing protein n=1 Tax=Embleya sp. NPDC008237 TaxID=3363978 RepID=UPI0036E56C63
MTQAKAEFPSWRKSSYSGQSGQECVEVAPLDGVVGARVSKDIARGHLAISPVAWAALMQSVKQ